MSARANPEKAFAELVGLEAAEFLRRHGSNAYHKAHEEMRHARNDGDAGLEKFYQAVSQAIARRLVAAEP